MFISRRTSQANRGKFLEEVIRQSNNRYKVTKQGIVIKVPTEWIPIRGAGGKITNAKVDAENKGIPDFMGNFTEIGPVAFDAKETSKGERFSFQHIEPEQVQWLQDLTEQGWTTFTVHYFAETDKCYLYPFKYMLDGYRRWEKTRNLPNHQKGRCAASVSPDDFQRLGYQIKPGQALALDYLAAIKEWRSQN